MGSSREIEAAYAELDLPFGASAEEVKSQRRFLAATFHPDKYPAGSAHRTKAEDKLKRVNAACDDVLKYLRAGGGGRTSPSQSGGTHSSTVYDAERERRRRSEEARERAKRAHQRVREAERRQERMAQEEERQAAQRAPAASRRAAAAVVSLFALTAAFLTAQDFRQARLVEARYELALSAYDRRDFSEAIEVLTSLPSDYRDVSDKMGRAESILESNGCIANSRGVVTGYVGLGGDVVIPEYIDGVRVTSIGWQAFLGQEDIVSVTISEGVTRIDGWAFSGCTSLTRVTLPESLRSIGHYSFFRCTSLEEVTIPYNVTSIGDYAFARCESLTDVTVPARPLSIGQSAFD